MYNGSDENKKQQLWNELRYDVDFFEKVQLDSSFQLNIRKDNRIPWRKGL